MSVVISKNNIYITIKKAKVYSSIELKDKNIVILSVDLIDLLLAICT